MAVDARVLAVIEAIYDAALDETRWTDTLRQLADLTGSQAATFWALDASDQPRLPLFTYINLDPQFIAEYLDGMVPLDPTVRYLVEHPDASIVHDGLVISERDKDRHPYYDWHGRHSDLRFRLVNQVCPMPAVQAGVALHRTRTAGRYEAQDIERFAYLHRHIQRALAMGIRLGSLGTLQRCTLDLLDRNPAAIVLLDERQRIVHVNRRAQDLRAKRDGIRLDAHGITLQHRQDNTRLQKLIAQALASVASCAAAPGGAMRAVRPSGLRSYLILVTPVARNHSLMSMVRPAVCVIITDPDDACSPPVERVQAAFGLTEAEARLAARLAGGEDLRSAALKLGIGYGTARVRLAEIFQKTQTHRQGELIRLLLAAMAMD